MKGNLHRKIITDKNGHRKTVWVKSGEEPKKERTKKTEEPKKEIPLKEHNPKLWNKVKRREAGNGKEISLSKEEALEVLQHGRVGLISAGVNPNDEHDVKLTEKEVEAREEELKAELVSKGYTFLKVKGNYDGEEDSFMVMVNDASKDEISMMGTKYNQDSVIYSDGNKNEMLFTTGDNKGARYVGDGFKEMGKEADNFYTEIKLPASTFKFQLDFDFEKLVKALTEKIRKAAATDYGECDLDELIKEHKRLVKVLKSSSKKDDAKELKIQESELKKLLATHGEMKKDMGSIEKGAKHFENLQKKTITDKTGHKRTVWVKIKEEAKKRVGAAKEEVKNRVKKEEAKYDTDKAANLFRRKLQGITQSIKKEVTDWKEAGEGIKNLATGKKVTDAEKKAIKTVAIHAGIVVGLAMAGGAPSGLALGKSIALGYLEHSGIIAVGHALMFAKGEDDGSDKEAEHYMERMIMSMANYVENQGKEDPKEDEKKEQKK